MIANSQPIGSLGALAPPPLEEAVVRQPETPTFASVLGRAIDNVSSALEKADALAVSVVANKGDIAEAAVARAKADVVLEIAAVTSAKVTGAINQLLQTQL
jgi:flagellar hook-basal body complex protein FliE